MTQCDELLSAVVRAQLGAIKHLPESYRREQIDAGMQALAGQVMLWAETCERSAQQRGTPLPISTPMPACFGTICTTFRCAKRSTAALGSAGSSTFNRSEIETDYYGRRGN
jgi:hypothetical protein